MPLSRWLYLFSISLLSHSVSAYNLNLEEDLKAPPRLFTNSEQLVELKNNSQGVLKQRYSNLLVYCDAIIAAETDEQVTAYTGNDSRAFYEAAIQAGYDAACLAIAYRTMDVSGTVDYDEDGFSDGYVEEDRTSYISRVRTILRRWAETNVAQIPAATNRAMHVVRGTVNLFYAYDLIRDDQHPGFDTTCQTWFLSLKDIINDGVADWEAGNEYGPYYGKQEYQNHLVAHTLGYALIGLTVDGKRDLAQRAFQRNSYDRDFAELIEGCIIQGDDGDDVELERGDDPVPAQNGEIYDRYRHYQHENEAGNYWIQGKGIQYSELTLTLLTLLAELGHQNGLDTWEYKGANGEYLRDSFEFYSDFFRTQDSSIKGGFYEHEKEDNWLKLAEWPEEPLFFMGNKYYPNTPGVVWYLNDAYPETGLASFPAFPDALFCHVELTHYDADVPLPQIAAYETDFSNEDHSFGINLTSDWNWYSGGWYVNAVDSSDPDNFKLVSPDNEDNRLIWYKQIQASGDEPIRIELTVTPQENTDEAHRWVGMVFNVVSGSDYCVARFKSGTRNFQVVHRQYGENASIPVNDILFDEKLSDEENDDYIFPDRVPIKMTLYCDGADEEDVYYRLILKSEDLTTVNHSVAFSIKSTDVSGGYAGAYSNSMSALYDDFSVCVVELESTD